MYSFPIDAVIPWVDGGDAVHKERRMRYGSVSALLRDDVGGDTRFSSVGEINWCVESVVKNAPFIRKIFIVTDGQDPHVQDFIQEKYPSSTVKIEVVDHRDIFAGYEQYLPVFNSRAIETMIWRIPGLSEHFLLLNDDFMICSPVSESDFFSSSGTPVCYASKFLRAWANILRALKPRRSGHSVVTFKSSLLNAASIAGGGAYILYLAHTPRPLLKSFFEAFYEQNPQLMLRNIRHRFRDVEQYNPQEVLYLSLLRKGECDLVDPSKVAVYMQPKNKPGYIAGKLRRASAEGCLFVCFNYLSDSSSSDQELVRLWVEQRLS